MDKFVISPFELKRVCEVAINVEYMESSGAEISS